MRMTLVGLLPACKAAEGMDERGQKKLEVAVARAVVKAQEVVTGMLREYRESTRRARAAKREELDAWRKEEQRRRAVKARAVKGLRALGRERGRERKRLREAVADAVAGAHSTSSSSRGRKAQDGADGRRQRRPGRARAGYTE